MRSRVFYVLAGLGMMPGSSLNHLYSQRKESSRSKSYFILSSSSLRLSRYLTFKSNRAGKRQRKSSTFFYFSLFLIPRTQGQASPLRLARRRTLTTSIAPWLYVDQTSFNIIQPVSPVIPTNWK